MKKLFFALALTASLQAVAQNYEISTPSTSLVVCAPQGGDLAYKYYGTKLSTIDLQNIDAVANLSGSAYPAYGFWPANESALAVTHADGNMTTVLKVTGVKTTQDGNVTITTISLKDELYPLYVDVHYKAYADVDMIETWSDIRNEEKREILLTGYASATLPIRCGNVWLSSLYGTWANEGRICCEPLTPGTKVVQNKDGVRNSHTAHAEVMFSLDGKPAENSGRVIGAALCYSGNYRLRITTGDTDYHQFFAGIDEENSTWHLAKGETFTTPALALTYSDEGLSEASRNFHRWGRAYKLAHGDKLRKILLNSWEGVYFDINQSGMNQMMADIASMGGELFVMDDGWFGDKYPRNTDNSSLGDWVVDHNKLPEGIEGLLRDAEKNKVKFGIWIEPEMTNTKSELYEKHPDWILKSPKREPILGRGGTQVVLDLCNPKVQNFVFGVFDNLLAKYPAIDYVKWDANMSILNHGSQYLPANRQSHLYIEWHRGLAKVCEMIRKKYPDVTIQACASGGGRANWGVLPWFDEFWVSDNTDALQRIYMQWGTSYFFPAMAMASHISAAPNHQTFRTIPLKYRIDVAMSGRLGMEIQPKNMTEDEKNLCRKAIADYKRIRPIVQTGDIYRLHSPYDGDNLASLMYVSQDKTQAVFYWWKLEHFVDEHLPRVKFAGLDPIRSYKITELNRIDNTPLIFEGMTFSGKYLMDNGLEIPYKHNVDYNKQNDWTSRVLLLE